VRTLESGWLTTGPRTEQFEREFREYIGAPQTQAVNSCTAGMHLALAALNIGPGTEVITTPLTFCATVNVILQVGATPVLADVGSDGNIDPASVAARITERTRAIMPVHLYGQMAALERLQVVARARDLPIIEDAAQAIGARRSIEGQWRRAGELGWASGFSFFPSKNLGAWGDGGMIVTSDDALAERLRKLRLHGGAKQYHHDEVGTNSRLDSLQAAVLLAKLPHLPSWSAKRREHAAYYTRAFADVPAVRPPAVDPANEHIFHQYTLRVQRRDELQAHLKRHGIGSAIYYPVPLHLQPCFSHLGYRPGRLPESERASREVLSLPVYPELTRGQLDCVIETIRGFYR